jgi:hypothetical protein
MTRTNERRVSDVTRGLSAQERVSLVYLTGLDGAEVDAEVYSPMGPTEDAVFMRGMGAIEAVYRGVGLMALDLQLRCEVLSWECRAASAYAWWGLERANLYNSEDFEFGDGGPGAPGDPAGVLGGLSRDEDLRPDDELAPRDLLTRRWVEDAVRKTPRYFMKLQALEHALVELLVEIGARDSPPPEIQDQLVGARGLLEETSRVLQALTGNPVEEPGSVDSEIHAGVEECLEVVKARVLIQAF